MNAQHLHQLALENLRVGATISRYVQESPPHSFCCGMMAHLAQLHQENARKLGSDSPGGSFDPADSFVHEGAVPEQAHIALRRCQELQWALIKEYRKVLKESSSLPVAELQKIEDQFRQLQQLVAGFEYNASISPKSGPPLS